MSATASASRSPHHLLGKMVGGRDVTDGSLLSELLVSRRSACVMSFGRRLAYESLRRTNPAGRCSVWGFRVWTRPERSGSGAGSCAQIERGRESEYAAYHTLGVFGANRWHSAELL
jgi:hypothetical protein